MRTSTGKLMRSRSRCTISTMAFIASARRARGIEYSISWNFTRRRVANTSWLASTNSVRPLEGNAVASRGMSGGTARPTAHTAPKA